MYSGYDYIKMKKISVQLDRVIPQLNSVLSLKVIWAARPPTLYLPGISGELIFLQSTDLQQLHFPLWLIYGYHLAAKASKKSTANAHTLKIITINEAAMVLHCLGLEIIGNTILLWIRYLECRHSGVREVFLLYF